MTHFVPFSFYPLNLVASFFSFRRSFLIWARRAYGRTARIVLDGFSGGEELSLEPTL